MYKHRLKKRAFQKESKQWRNIIEHTNANFGSGINDKNGREIFEGDKVRYDGKVYTVEFSRGSFRIGDMLLFSCSEDPDNELEIVGE